MAIAQTFIQELLSRTDVVEIVGRHVQLKKSGANFVGLCPFHNEKSPSFSVSPSKQFYHCFGCGKNGNAISFLIDHSGMTFIEAVKHLAQHHGMRLPEEKASPESQAHARTLREKQHTLSSVLAKAAAAYHQHLKHSTQAITYLKKRGISGEVAKQFAIGYAPQGWHHLASTFPDYTSPLLVESGLVITHIEENSHKEEKRYDRFRDRIMFPIRNVQGECIGFGGRVLGDGTPKYLNSPETPVFSKGRELYGLFEARSALREMGYALVTEGYMDVVALTQLGFPNAVATLGTACTPEHMQKLLRFTDSVVFSFDGDSAGRRAARKALESSLPLATDVRTIKFVFLPAEHDPDSFIRIEGKDAFARYVQNATPLSRFLIDCTREGCDLHTAEGRARLASNAKPLWSQLPEGALKMQLLTEIAGLAQLTNQELSSLWLVNASPLPSHTQGPRDSLNSVGGKSSFPRWRSKTFATAARSQPASRADHAARLVLRHPELWNMLSNEDHHLLCQLPQPHGTLFAWIEGQWHEHGPLSWENMREHLVGHATQVLAERLMADTTVSHEHTEDCHTELADLLKRMRIEHIKEEETIVIQTAKDDPASLLRYQELRAQRLELVRQLEQSKH